MSGWWYQCDIVRFEARLIVERVFSSGGSVEEAYEACVDTGYFGIGRVPIHCQVWIDELIQEVFGDEYGR